MAAPRIRTSLANLFNNLINSECSSASCKIRTKFLIREPIYHYHHIRYFTAFTTNSQLLLSSNLKYCTSQKYQYSKKKSKKQSLNAGDSDDDVDDDENSSEVEAALAGKNAKVVSVTVPSMRIDAVAKSGFGIARNKVEVALYQSKLRVNGEKVLKKSYQVHIDDELDIVQGPSPKNPKFIIVNRVKVLNAVLDEDNYKVKLLREKSLLIENYDDSWSPSSEI